MSQIADSLRKRFEGRDEAILDPELPIIDAHHHLYERPGLRYMLDDYLADGTAAPWEPYVETAIELFGVNRCMMESDFPPDGRSCGHVPLWNALKYVTREYAWDEKLSLFRDNAARVYRVDLPNGGGGSEYQ
jgi:predicted TIM-barrel fold metal-dependent hydrolase